MQKIPVKIFFQYGRLAAFNITLNGVEHLTADFYQNRSNINDIDLRTSNTTRVAGDNTNTVMLNDMIAMADKHDERMIETEAELVYDEAKFWGISCSTIRLIPGTLS